MILISIFLFTAFVLLGFWLLRTLWMNDARTTPTPGRGKGKARKTAPERQEMNPFLHTLLLNRLDKLASEGAFAEAIELFANEPMPKPRAADELSTHVTILRIMVRCYEAQADWQNAQDCYRKAIEFSRKIGSYTRDLEAGLHLCEQKSAGAAPSADNYDAVVVSRPQPAEWQTSRASL